MSEIVVSKEMVKRPVVFWFNDQEFAQRAKDIAKINAQIRELRAESEQHKAKIESQIAYNSSLVDSISREISHGKEIRIVDCQEAKDFGLRVVRYFYSGRLVDERKMTEEEVQNVINSQTSEL